MLITFFNIRNSNHKHTCVEHIPNINFVFYPVKSDALPILQECPIYRAATGLGNTLIYLVTNFFVHKGGKFNIKGVNLFQKLCIFQGNTKGDQWNTVNPLKVPLTVFWMCFKHFDHHFTCFRSCFRLRCKDQNIAKGTTDLRNCIKRERLQRTLTLRGLT